MTKNNAILERRFCVCLATKDAALVVGVGESVTLKCNVTMTSVSRWDYLPAGMPVGQHPYPLFNGQKWHQDTKDTRVNRIISSLEDTEDLGRGIMKIVDIQLFHAGTYRCSDAKEAERNQDIHLQIIGMGLSLFASSVSTVLNLIHSASK